MNTKKLMNTALNGLDRLGYTLDQYGITGKVNRHNLAAFVMAEQKHLEGHWDSLQVRYERRRSSIEALLQSNESRAGRMLSSVLKREKSV